MIGNETKLTHFFAKILEQQELESDNLTQFYTKKKMLNDFKDILFTFLIYLFTMIFIYTVNVLKSEPYNRVPLQKCDTL